MPALNKNNSAVKRIMQEARELANDPCTDYSAAPLEDDIFEWHCTLRGPAGTEFEGGLYHFRILLPAEYPFRPPSIMILTPNGRFELNTKICISFTSYHEEEWQPAWGVRTAIIGLQGFFPLKGQAAVGVGSIEYPATERKRLAALSREWSCPHCQKTNLELLPDPPASDKASDSSTQGETITPAPSQEPVAVSPVVTTTAPPVDAQATTERSPSSVNTTSAPFPVTPATPQVSVVQSPLPARGTTADVTATTASPPLPPSSSHAGPAPTAAQTARRPTNRSSSQKPPVLLDTAICILLVLLFAIICRRVV